MVDNDHYSTPAQECPECGAAWDYEKVEYGCGSYFDATDASWPWVSGDLCAPVAQRTMPDKPTNPTPLTGALRAAHDELRAEGAANERARIKRIIERVPGFGSPVNGTSLIEREALLAAIDGGA